MVGVDRGVIEHKLIIRHETKEIKTKKMHPGAIQEQVNKRRVGQTNQIGHSQGGNLPSMDCQPDYGKKTR